MNTFGHISKADAIRLLTKAFGKKHGRVARQVVDPDTEEILDVLDEEGPLTEEDDKIKRRNEAHNKWRPTFVSMRKEGENIDAVEREIFLHHDNFKVDFSWMTGKEKSKIFEFLANILEDKIGTQGANEKFIVGFEDEFGWHSKPLTPEVLKPLIKNFRENQKNYVITQAQREAIESSDAQGNELPHVNYYRSFALRKIKRGVKKAVPQPRPNGARRTTNKRQGSFWSWLNPTGLDLSRYQIFDSLVDEHGKPRAELNDSCFIYALTKSGQFSARP
jgi:hypothetical protein